MLARGLEAIQRNAHVQTRLISDILDVSRVRLGKLPLEVESLDAREVVESSASALAVALDERSLTLAIEAQDNLQPIIADSARMQQIVWNLLTNAIKFSAPGGRIRVALTQDADWLTLSVEDGGQGIDAAFLPQLFDRFTQSDPSSNRKHGGLGLGLSIVKQLVLLHGGTVHAFSAGPGLGATFTVVLPRVAAAQSSPDDVLSQFDDLANGERRRGRLADARILVVEDDEDAREILVALLSSEEAVCLQAENYAQALERLEQADRIDVLVSDVGMPGKDGYELMREIRRREKGSGERLPAIALTAFARAKDREERLRQVSTRIVPSRCGRKSWSTQSWRRHRARRPRQRRDLCNSWRSVDTAKQQAAPEYADWLTVRADSGRRTGRVGC